MMLLFYNCSLQCTVQKYCFAAALMCVHDDFKKFEQLCFVFTSNCFHPYLKQAPDAVTVILPNTMKGHQHPVNRDSFIRMRCLTAHQRLCVISDERKTTTNSKSALVLSGKGKVSSTSSSGETQKQEKLSASNNNNINNSSVTTNTANDITTNNTDNNNTKNNTSNITSNDEMDTLNTAFGAFTLIPVDKEKIVANYSSSQYFFTINTDHKITKICCLYKICAEPPVIPGL